MSEHDPSAYEQHPLLPSGYWTGFYVYNRASQRHEMTIMLDFIRGKIAADGADDVGAFTFTGSYDLNAMTCSFMKHYRKHQIEYHGHIDENGIWGKWNHVYNDSYGIDKDLFQKLVGSLGGGFHIWPSAREFSEHEMAHRKIQEEKVVKSVQPRLLNLGNCLHALAALHIVIYELLRVPLSSAEAGTFPT